MAWFGSILQFSATQASGDRRKSELYLQKITIGFPYDYFNYDESRAWYSYESGQMLAVSQLEDWHNCQYISKEEVNSYIVGMELFGKKYMDFYGASENIYNHSVCSEHYELGHTYQTMHEDKIQMNVQLFGEFVEFLSHYCQEIVAVVQPFCMDYISNPEMMDGSREKYYDIMNCYGIRVYDYHDMWQSDNVLFADATHLNFTELINQEILTD